MKSNNRILLSTALSGLLALGVTTASTQALAAEKEKCFGVAKAGKNDCQTATSSCAGTSTKDGQKDAFLLVASGTCGKLVGGNTKSM